MNPEPYRAMYCPVCKLKDEYYGRLVFASEEGTPMCPNHKAPLPLVNTTSGVRTKDGVIRP